MQKWFKFRTYQKIYFKLRFLNFHSYFLSSEYFVGFPSSILHFSNLQKSVERHGFKAQGKVWLALAQEFSFEQMHFMCSSGDFQVKFSNIPIIFLS